jgi:hypothetical protein
MGVAAGTGTLDLSACSAPMTRASTSTVRATDADSRDAVHVAPAGLFVYPLESNFSGARYDPGLVKQVQQHGLRVSRDGGVEELQDTSTGAHAAVLGGRGQRWCVMLDAAKACCSMPPDLSRSPADFVVREL